MRAARPKRIGQERRHRRPVPATRSSVAQARENPETRQKTGDHQSVDVSRRIGDPRNQVPCSPRRHNALIRLPSRRGRSRMADRWFTSSTTCSCCGSVKSEPELLRRVFRCGGSRLERREKSKTFGRMLCAVSQRRGALWRGFARLLEASKKEEPNSIAEICAAQQLCVGFGERCVWHGRSDKPKRGSEDDAAASAETCAPRESQTAQGAGEAAQQIGRCALLKQCSPAIRAGWQGWRGMKYRRLCLQGN